MSQQLCPDVEKGYPSLSPRLDVKDLSRRSSRASNTYQREDETQFPSPTAVGLVGFVLANTPATCMLLGWVGAGGRDGNEAAAIGAYIYFGCLLEILCGIAEWICGETFNAIVFLSLGAYFGASGIMMIPFYNAVSGYAATSGGLEAYNNSYASFLITMGVLLLLFTLASLRVDFCHVLLFACFTICFPCLAASYRYMGEENHHMAQTLRMWGSITSLIGTVIAWYLVSSSYHPG